MSYIKVSDPYEVDGKWYWGQSLESETGMKIWGPVFYGPYDTEEEAQRHAKLRINQLSEFWEHQR